jgi:hypothetical protein
VIFERGESGSEPAAQFLADGDLHDSAALAGGDPTPLPGLPAFESFKKERLSFPTAVEEQAGGLANPNGRLFSGEDEWKPSRSLSLSHQEIKTLMADGTEVVFSLIEEPVSPQFQTRDGHRGLAFLIVLNDAFGELYALSPEIQN